MYREGPNLVSQHANIVRRSKPLEKHIEISHPNGKKNECIQWPEMLVFLTNLLMFFLFLGCVVKGYMH